MDGAIVIAIAIVVLAFGLVSKRLEHGVITAPMIFVVFGLIVGRDAFGFVELSEGTSAIHLFAEVTLILVLFGDATRIDLRALRREYKLPLRMLTIGMPLTIGLGTVLAVWIFPQFTVFEAALLAAILAPTDAALGQAVISEPAVPARVRQSLNVESGLNDGVALPVVLILASCAEAMGERELSPFVIFTAKQLLLGPLLGVVVGYLGGRAILLASERGWMSHQFQQLSSVAIAVLSFACAEAVGGNGFIAAFVAGLTMGNTSRAVCGSVYDFMETEGTALVLVTFLLFGAVMVPAAAHDWGLAVWAFVLASLTIVRMLPVAISLARLDLKAPTYAFLGFFGPRGLASILFALLIVGRTGIGARDEIVAIVVATVLVSVFLHGISAYPAARRYGRYIAGHQADPSCAEHQRITIEIPVRVPLHTTPRTEI